MQLHDFYATLYLSGDFSIDDGKGSENVTIKMKSHQFFQLCRGYSSLLKMSKEGEFPGVDFLERKTKICRGFFTSSIKRKNSDLHFLVVVQWRQGNEQKSACVASAKLLLCQSKPIACLSFSLPLLKLPPSKKHCMKI